MRSTRKESAAWWEHQHVCRRALARKESNLARRASRPSGSRAAWNERFRPAIDRRRNCTTGTRPLRGVQISAHQGRVKEESQSQSKGNGTKGRSNPGVGFDACDEGERGDVADRRGNQ